MKDNEWTLDAWNDLINIDYYEDAYWDIMCAEVLVENTNKPLLLKEPK